MPTQGPFNFAGGYSPGYSFLSVPRGFASDMKNVRFLDGTIQLRWAQTVVNNATLGSGYVNGLTSWKDNVNSVTALVATCNGKIQIANATSYSPNATITFTDETGSATVSNSQFARYAFDSLNGILVGVGNSSNAGVPFQITAYNSGAANLAGSPPSGDAIKQVNNFMFIGRQLGNTTTYSTVSWSNVSDPQTWNAASFVNVSYKDGEPVMALGAIGTNLYIFKQSSIFSLSTVTQTISGSVTLGPLTQVIKGIGCAGPLALDNLPNGNIVFMGYDGHFYEFDGSTVLDLCHLPYPGQDAYNNHDGAVFGGLSIAVCNAQTVVKTWKGTSEVMIGFDGNISGSSNFYNLFSYNYIDRIWNGYISDTFPKCMTTIDVAATAAAFLEGQNQILFHGNATGNVYGHGFFGNQSPVDESGNPVDARIGTTIQLANESMDFVPRSICFDLSAWNTNLSFGLFAVYDSKFIGGVNAIYSITPGSTPPVRNIGNFAISQESVGNVFPILISLEWIFLATGSVNNIISLGNFYISDQVIR